MHEVEFTHKGVHELLHKHLDELAADYMLQHPGKLLSNTTLLELVVWSGKQVEKPTGPFLLPRKP